MRLTRTELSDHPKVHVVNHPLIAHKLGIMRKNSVSTKDFRELAMEVGALLTYEATRDLSTETINIQNWIGQIEVEQIQGKKMTLVPILRAGLGMTDGVLLLIPGAKISHVGLFRNEETLEPVPYYQKWAANIEHRVGLIVDPMLATGGSMDAAIKMLKRINCLKIKALVLVCAPEGLNMVLQNHPDVDIYTAAIDEGLDKKGFIIPGLGDAGDKLFGTK